MTRADNLEARIEDLQVRFAGLLDEYLVVRERLRTLEAATGDGPRDDAATGEEVRTRTPGDGPDERVAWPEWRSRSGRGGVGPATQAEVEAAIERVEATIEDEVGTGGGFDGGTDGTGGAGGTDGTDGASRGDRGEGSGTGGDGRERPADDVVVG
ncbi:hypothetical protein [Halomarina pelagica]|uniref:hypothetical protein n=1 Tax=Halomarina pelagica TaxID=2961599 RepID=UPI0020C2255A|nr:hypothetical protein [Halomarina sp. BND7]